MSQDQREYKRLWMRNKRHQQHVARLIAEGKCPHCEIVLMLAPLHDCLSSVTFDIHLEVMDIHTTQIVLFTQPEQQ